jgi:thiamine biosynthesis protein ThiC
MMTQLELARKGIILPQMRAVAEQEGVEAEFVRQGVASGTIVISANAAHKSLVPCGIGQGLRTKVNANIGTSSDFGNVETELAKLQAAVECGADTVMHLSTGADFLCYVTPAEHLSLSDLDDVCEGVIASRIAAHAADIAKGAKGAAQRDLEMSLARKRLDWKAQEKLSLRPELSRRAHHKHDTTGDACSMCGEYCAMRLVEDYLGVSAGRH